MNPTGTPAAENLQADIVVVGGGGAGMAAALAAAEKGARNIILLEARHAPGGNSVFPTGIFAAESHVQKRLGINAPKDDFFQQSMNYTHFKINPRLVRSLVDKSGDTIRWLEAKGVKFVNVLPFYSGQVSPTFHVTEGPATTGASVVRALINNCQDLGIHFLCQIRARKLLTGKGGNVTGVLAEKKDQTINITAKCVVIATGGFAGNADLIRKYLPYYNMEQIRLGGIPNPGDGLLMATEIGAASEGMVVLEMGGPYFPWSPHLSPVFKRPKTIWVNKKGERFAAETALFSEAANCIYRQPDQTSYTLFDEKIKQRIIEEGLTPFERLLMDNRSFQDGVDKNLQLQADEGKIKISNSWGEIAGWLGIMPEVMGHTVDEYNSFCDLGYDTCFLKSQEHLLPLRNPPYYAAQTRLRLIITHGGIKIDHNMQVLNQQDDPISGLFAAGVETGGTDWDTYNFELTGHSFGFAINTGRIAGENAAAYALRNG